MQVPVTCTAALCKKYRAQRLDPPILPKASSGLVRGRPCWTAAQFAESRTRSHDDQARHSAEMNPDPPVL